MMVAGRDRNDLIEVLALDPELVFAGRVAGVFAAFEHGDHYDLNADWLAGRDGLGEERGAQKFQEEQSQNQTSADFVHLKRPSLLICLICLICCASRERIYITACGRKSVIVPSTTKSGQRFAGEERYEKFESDSFAKSFCLRCSPRLGLLVVPGSACRLVPE